MHQYYYCTVSGAAAKVLFGENGPVRIFELVTFPEELEAEVDDFEAGEDPRGLAVWYPGRVDGGIRQNEATVRALADGSGK